MSNLDTGNVLGIFAFLVSIGGVIYTAINHKRFRLKCCGKDIDVSVDVEDTTKKPKDETSLDTLQLQKEQERERAPLPEPALARAPLPAPELETPQNHKHNDDDDGEEEDYVDRRIQNIKENERNEVLKAKYALRVANARKYNKKVAPLPPLLSPS